MLLHEHLVGVEVAVPGAGNQVGASHLGPGLLLCPAIGSRPVMPRRMPLPARASGMRVTRGRPEGCANCTRTVCDDPMGEAWVPRCSAGDTEHRETPCTKSSSRR